MIDCQHGMTRCLGKTEYFWVLPRGGLSGTAMGSWSCENCALSIGNDEQGRLLHMSTPKGKKIVDAAFGVAMRRILAGNPTDYELALAARLRVIYCSGTDEREDLPVSA